MINAIIKWINKFLVVVFAVSILFCAGCSKNDIALAKGSTLGNRDATVSSAFQNCRYIETVSWESIESEKGQRTVRATVALPVKAIIEDLKNDSGNWLSMERDFFLYASERINTTSMLITFAIGSDNTTSVEKIQFGIGIPGSSALTTGLSKSEIDKMLDIIFEDQEGLIPAAAHHINPSFNSGKLLFEEVIGKTISDFR